MSSSVASTMFTEVQLQIYAISACIIIDLKRILDFPKSRLKSFPDGQFIKPAFWMAIHGCDPLILAFGPKTSSICIPRVIFIPVYIDYECVCVGQALLVCLPKRLKYIFVTNLTNSPDQTKGKKMYSNHIRDNNKEDTCVLTFTHT